MHVTERSKLECWLCHTTATETATRPYTPHCETSTGYDRSIISNYRDSLMIKQ